MGSRVKGWPPGVRRWGPLGRSSLPPNEPWPRRERAARWAPAAGSEVTGAPARAGGCDCLSCPGLGLPWSRAWGSGAPSRGAGGGAGKGGPALAFQSGTQASPAPRARATGSGGRRAVEASQHPGPRRGSGGLTQLGKMALHRGPAPPPPPRPPATQLGLLGAGRPAGPSRQGHGAGSGFPPPQRPGRPAAELTAGQSRAAGGGVALTGMDCLGVGGQGAVLGGLFSDELN